MRRWAADHAEIVDGDIFVDGVDLGEDFLPRFGSDAVIGDDGIHMDRGIAAELCAQRLPLRVPP